MLHYFGDALIQAESKLVVACVCSVSRAVGSKTGFKKLCMLRHRATMNGLECRVRGRAPSSSYN